MDVAVGANRAARLAGSCAALVVAVFATVVVAGWTTRTRGLVEFRPGQPPVLFTTALCLAGLAVATLLLLSAHRRWAPAGTVPAAVLGTLTLAQYATGADLRVDRLVDPFVSTGRYPGRMPVNTALCLVLLALTLSLAAWRPDRRDLLLACGASLVAAVALLALFGYVAGIRTAYAWRDTTPMSPGTGVALSVLSLAGLLVAWQDRPAGEPGLPRWLPVPVAVTALALTTFGWLALLGRAGRDGVVPVEAAATAVLAVGAVVSLLTGTLTYVAQLAQRRRASLGVSNDRMRERIELDRLVASAYADVVAAPDVQAGLAELFGYAGKVAQPDRASFALAAGDGLRIVAATGPAARRVPVGREFRLVGELRAAADGARPIRIPDTAEYPHDDPLVAQLRANGVRSYVGVPTVAQGRVVALTSFSSAVPDAFGGAAVDALDELVRGCAGVLSVLWLIAEERATSARLRELDAMKNEFVGVVAHDLRSPMTVITGYVDTVLNRWDELPDDTKRELLGTASRNTRRLSGLIEDVLQVARIESGDFPYEIRPFDLGALVRRTAEEMQSRAPEHPIRVEVDPALPLAYADEDRQWRVLTNLLANAQKYAPGPVDVTVGPDGRSAVVRVRDHGPGIPPEHRDRLFEKFSRIPSTVAKEKGTGLGLYICRSLVEAQGGWIGVDTEVGEGTTFTYTVPLAG